MAGISTTGTTPNYQGALFQAARHKTPFLSMIGGLGNTRVTTNQEFPTGVLYETEAAAQPAISETASMTAPAITSIAREQEVNTTQIFQYTFGVSYNRMGNSGRLAADGESLTAGLGIEQPDELAFQRAAKLQKLAKDLEYTFLCGKYQKSTGDSVASKTRGMIELCSTGNTIAAGNEAITIDMIEELMIKMFDAGAEFTNPVLFCSARVRKQISDLYAKLYGFTTPATRTVGGYAIETIVTNQCTLGIVQDFYMPNDTILVADMAYISPVFLSVPNKGTVFVEDLAKEGASFRQMLYATVGLAHGPAFLHGSITGIKTSESELDLNSVGKAKVGQAKAA